MRGGKRMHVETLAARRPSPMMASAVIGRDLGLGLTRKHYGNAESYEGHKDNAAKPKH